MIAAGDRRWYPRPSHT